MRYLASGRGLDAGFVAHPSFVESCEVEDIVSALSIVAPEAVHIFTAEKGRAMEDILFKKDVPYQLGLYGIASMGLP